MKRSIRYSLSTTEQDSFAKACDASDFNSVEETDQKKLLEIATVQAKLAAQETPNLAQNVRYLRNLRNSPGLIVLEHLPKVKDPRLLILIVGSILGAVDREANEGDYVIPIKEQQTKPGERPSFKTAGVFYFHTDLSYAPNPPLFLLMHSVVNNLGEGGLSLFADIEVVIKKLSALDIAELQKPQFLFPAPPHYRGGGVVQFPILTQSTEDEVWRLRFRRDNLRAETRTGMEAVVQLIKAINDSHEEVMLETDSLVLLDNQSFLHGRTAFAGGGQNAKEPRHLNRIYVGM
jgi:alpha-ketoglutarate-dependent taurine dioxygenase